jgi:competence protein ComEC
MDDRPHRAPALSLSAPRYQPLVTLAFSVAGGMVLDRYGRPDLLGLARHAEASVAWFAAWWCLASLCLIAWWLAWRRHRIQLAAWPLLASAALAGAAWHHIRWNLFGAGEIGRYATDDSGPACIEAVAREAPQRVPAPTPTPLRAIPGNERSRVRVEVSGIRDGTRWRQASGECELFVAGHLVGVEAGDRLRIFGQLARVGPPLNPGEFDFAAHARADRQLARLRSSAPDCIAVTASASGWQPSGLLHDLRDGAKRLVRRFVGPDRAALASAILLGARGGLTAEETEPYLLTGTVHVLVVSGMNVAILATGLYALMRIGWLARRAALTVIIAVAVAYAALAEAQPPVVRAAVFAALVCFAAWSGRRGVAFNSLACAALIVLAINPGDLFRVGPQLSFLAVAMLVRVGHWSVWRRSQPSDPLDRLLAAARPWHHRALAWFRRWAVWLLATSLAVWLTTLPLVLHHFHVASPIAILLSPLVLLVVFVAMWSGFVMLAVGWLIPWLGGWCGALCGGSLGALEWLVRWSESLPAGHFWAPGPAWWWVLVFYLGLLAAMIYGRAGAAGRWQLALGCAWILVGLAPPLVRAWTRDGLECSVVAVGHGTCVLLEAPTGETLLYDAGSLGSPEYATQRIAAYLWHRGIMRIDGLVISHADIDHYNAVPGLLERFRIGTIYVSPMMFDSFGETATSAGPEVLRQAIGGAGVPIREVWSGDRLRVGTDVTLEVLHPPQDGVIGSDNANSITLAVEYGGQRILLPGDLESPGLEDVMAELPYDCDVLLAPHHGSRRSDPPGFAAWSTPEWVVISGGGGDEVLPVVRTYEQAGAEVMRTNERGTLHFSIERGAIKLTTWR